MIASGWAAIVLVVLGAVSGAGGLTLAGVLIGLVTAVRSMWSRFGLRSLIYERHLSSLRVVCGEQIRLELVVRNRKPLPLPWLEITDLVSRGAVIAGRTLDPSDRRGFDALRAVWSVGWFERVTRALTIEAARRGIYRFETARLQVADLFAPGGAVEERDLPLTYRVVPRLVPVRSSTTLSPTAGSIRARSGLIEEPSLFAGIRPYQPGDQLRRVHWKATARLGRPVSRRFDPAREREVVLALDIQTLPGPHWVMAYDDELVEALCVTAMSLARSEVQDGVALGFAVNAFTNRPVRTTFVPPSAAPSQVTLIADLLAAVSPFPSLPFTDLLRGVPRRARPGSTIVALSVLDPVAFLPVLRRLQAQGYAVSHASLGPSADRWRARARSVGVQSVTYRLAPDWRTADALERVG